ncbi:MAG: CDP-alcohol phosphatidyltransferase family protein [Chlamydiia bacterium]
MKNPRNLVPNAITTFGLTCGLFALFVLVMPGDWGVSPLPLCLGLVLLAAFADLLDGMVARAIHAETEFGSLFDSLSDAITFGVTPATVILASLQPERGSWMAWMAGLGALLFAVCGVLRLVRFSIQHARARTEVEIQQGMKHFTGLPIPAAALALLSLEYFWQSSWLETALPSVTGAPSVHVGLLAGACFVLAYLMVSRIKFPSIKLLHFKVRSFTLAVGSAVASMALLFGLLHSLEWLAVFLTWGYVLLGCVLALLRWWAGPQSPALQEFEPEEEEELDN